MSGPPTAAARDGGRPSTDDALGAATDLERIVEAMDDSADPRMETR